MVFVGIMLLFRFFFGVTLLLSILCWYSCKFGKSLTIFTILSRFSRSSLLNNWLTSLWWSPVKRTLETNLFS